VLNTMRAILPIIEQDLGHSVLGDET
jgi:hypothetical protein